MGGFVSRRSRNMRGVVVALLLLVGLMMVASPASASADVLDQQQLDGGAFGVVVGGANGTELAQTFTAGITGQLDRVDLFIASFDTAQGPLTVDIRDVVGGLPDSTGSALATTTVQAGDVSSRQGFVPVLFTSPASVTAGTQYAIVASVGSTSDVYRWWFDSAPPSLDVYPRGRACDRDTVPSAATWNCDNGVDFAFRTYVIPSDVTPPTVTCTASPSKLQSNNHKLITITTTVTVTDSDSGPNGSSLLSVTSNQPDNGLALGDVPNDIQGWAIGSADTSGQLRQERYGADRVYTLTYRGYDAVGNHADCHATVTAKLG